MEHLLKAPGTFSSRAICSESTNSGYLENHSPWNEEPGVLDTSHTPQVPTAALRGPQPTGEMGHGGKRRFRVTTVPPSAAFIFHPNG